MTRWGGAAVSLDGAQKLADEVLTEERMRRMTWTSTAVEDMISASISLFVLSSGTSMSGCGRYSSGSESMSGYRWLRRGALAPIALSTGRTSSLPLPFFCAAAPFACGRGTSWSCGTDAKSNSRFGVGGSSTGRRVIAMIRRRRIVLPSELGPRGRTHLTVSMLKTTFHRTRSPARRLATISLSNSMYVMVVRARAARR